MNKSYILVLLLVLSGCSDPEPTPTVTTPEPESILRGIGLPTFDDNVSDRCTLLAMVESGVLGTLEWHKWYLSCWALSGFGCVDHMYDHDFVVKLLNQYGLADEL